MVDVIIDFITTELMDDPDMDLQIDEDLLGTDILDSIGVMQLVAHLEEQFGLEISAEEITIENFETVQAIANFLGTKAQN